MGVTRTAYGMTLTAPDEREGLINLLFKTGVVRVTDGAGMSKTPPGAPHDGEYPLRRYVKIVESF
ncbi:MAG: hypothetical protein FWC62_05595 [Firmicutes bacterium]|nr:hypothetical protein [Bacillota bacterium]